MSSSNINIKNRRATFDYEIVESFTAGIVLTGKPTDDLKVLELFFKEPGWRERLKEMGENGRKAAVENYSRAKLAEKYVGILQDAGKGK